MRRSSWALPYAIFLVVFVVLPLMLIAVYAFRDAHTGELSMRNFMHFFEHPEVIRTFIYSMEIGLLTTLLCLVLGYPASYFLSKMRSSSADIIMMLFILPMWINMLIRTMATVSVFDMLHLPLGQGALIFGMVYNYIPFMILPIFNVLQKMDQSYVEAAQDLGAKPSTVFWKVVFPLSMPGIKSGILMVFLPTVSTFALAELLTMNKIRLFGTVIQEAINNSMWNYGAALSFVMLVIIAVTSLFDDSDKSDQTEAGGLI